MSRVETQPNSPELQTSLFRDYIRLMHFPLPLCVISFVTLGAILSPVVHWDRLLWTYLIVFTSLCLASYCFDELKGRPWQTQIPERQLLFLGWAGLGISLFGGVYLALQISLALLLWIPPSVFVILAYNQELFHGRFHNGIFFSLGWGGIPVLGSYYLQTISISPVALLTAAATISYSLAIWTLTHEFRPEIENVKKILGQNNEALTIRKSAKRTIWKITRILCYSLTLFTIAFVVYRFFP